MTIIQKDLDDIEERLSGAFFTKKDLDNHKDRLFNKLDDIEKILGINIKSWT
jgi:hypothetical protein